MGARGAVAVVVMVAVGMIVTMVVIMIMVMMMMVVMSMPLGMVVPVWVVTFDPGFAFAASADGTHHSTSSSLIRISSPPLTWSL